MMRFKYTTTIGITLTFCVIVKISNKQSTRDSAMNNKTLVAARARKKHT
ncbi:hypothetical protein ETAE_1825 [Edwardsiella piscicida]|uniref:Lipoprotein n=1 Tax=Edwardsiella piscicida TaxID=1263550 RepID=A0AAU8P3J1_EDWPI|nr:hypothetical protein ETAE_1825 [Edwardsiella tarda EIB202]